MKLSIKAKRIVVAAVIVIAIVVLVALAWLNQLHDVASLKTYLNDLRDVILAVVQIAALVLLLVLVSMILTWLTKHEGTAVLPFQNATDEAKYDGRAISDSLIAELQRISQIHQTEIEGMQLETEKVTIPAWKPSTEDVSASIAEVGAIGIGDTTVSVGRVLMTLKRMWPFGDPGSMITGSIQKYGSVYRLFARMENRTGIRAWVVTREIKGDSELTLLIRDLAYNIVKDLSPKIEASLEAFKFFTESINDYSLYNHTRAPEDLARAENQCLEAYKHDWNYTKISSLFYNFGVEEFDREDFARAVLMLEPATKLQGADARTFFGLGYAFAELNRDEDAVVAYRRAIELNPKYAYPHDGLGNVYADLGRTDEAIAEYQKSIELDPKDAYPHNGLGIVYADQGRSDEALAEFKTAIDLDPKYGAAYYGLGSLLVSLNQLLEATKYLEKSVELNPKRAVRQTSLAGIYRKLGREAEAVEHLNIARELTIKETEYNRACFEAICGNVSEALELLKQAIAKAPGDRLSARRDPDFDNIRSDPRFKALVGE